MSRVIRLAGLVAALVMGASCSKEPAPAAGAGQHAGHDLPAAPAGHGDHADGSSSAHAEHLPSGYAPVELAADRIQLFGVRTEAASRQALVRDVRTVGIVRSDETRESHVHVKWTGWIEEFSVSYVGQRVAKDDPLFSVYSPELLTAEQELLVAARRAATARTAGRPADIESAELLLDTGRRKLRLWDVPDPTVAAIAKTGEVQRLITGNAPRAGTVIEKTALPGMYVEPAMDLYTIADLEQVWILADLYEYEIPLVAIGQTASIAPVGGPSGQPDIAATVAFIAPSVDPMTRTVKVRFEVPNADGRLRPGAYATVRLAVPLAETVVIPADAVIETGERAIAFVRVADGVFEPRALQLGGRAGDRVQVLTGITDGEEVVTRAQFMLDSESRLRAASGVGMAGHGGH